MTTNGRKSWPPTPNRFDERPMIVNSYFVFLAFVGALRLVLAILVVVFGFRAWLVARAADDPAERDRATGRDYLLFLLVLVLLGLSLASWPLLYLMLQSYVPEFQGVMCIYGVTRI